MTGRTAAVLLMIAATAVVGVLLGPAAAVVTVQLLVAAAIVLTGARAVRHPKATRLPSDHAEAQTGRRQWSSLHQLGSTVMIGLQSRHHYDAALRPRLQRILSAVLSGRRGADLGASPALAADAVGPELWPLVDPARPASRDSSHGGVRIESLESLLDRIERL